MSNALSTVVLQAGSVKPEIRLQRAIAEFEQILDEGQRDLFARFRSEDGSPTVNSVIATIGELGRQRQNAQSDARPWVAPRFRKFLSTIRALTTLVDMTISGSQNLIASAVWGVVKTALESISRRKDYYEKFSQLFLKIGRSCPNVDEYVALFPNARVLQNAVYDYVITTISLCKAVVIFGSKSKASQMLSAATSRFEDHFGDFQSQLKDLSRSIDSQLILHIAKQQVEDRKLQEKERRVTALMFSRHNEQAKRNRRSRLKANLLRASSTYSSEATWFMARKSGDNQWLLGSQDYMLWKADELGSALECTGTLGSGKTVTAANVLEDVMLSKRPCDPVGYHFYSHTDARSADEYVIVKSLASQIIASGRLLDEADDDTIEAVETWASGTSNVRTALEAISRSSRSPEARNKDRKLYLIIDGLDSIKTVIADLMSPFVKVFGHFTLKLFYTARSKQRWRLPNFSWKHVDINISRPKEFVENYIRAELSRRVIAGELVVGDPELILEINERLSGGANGMMLWVFLQLESICHQRTDDAIRDCLDDLPEDLSAAYRKILYDIKRGAGCASSRNTLDWNLIKFVCGAAESLTLQELQEALSVEPGKTTWSSARLVNDMSLMIRDCLGLLVVNEEDDKVSWVHESCSDYLNTSGPTSHDIDLQVCSIELGIACVTYLSLDVVNRQVGSATPKRIISSDFVTGLASQSIPQKKDWVKSVVLKLLTESKKSSFDVSHHLPVIKPVEEPPPLHHFKDYSTKYWKHHTEPFKGHKLSPAAIKSLHTAAYVSPYSVSIESELHRKYGPEFPAHERLLEFSRDLHDWTYRFGRLGLLSLLLTAVRAHNEAMISMLVVSVALPTIYAEAGVNWNETPSLESTEQKSFLEFMLHHFDRFDFLAIRIGEETLEQLRSYLALVLALLRGSVKISSIDWELIIELGTNLLWQSTRTNFGFTGLWGFRSAPIYVLDNHIASRWVNCEDLVAQQYFSEVASSSYHPTDEMPESQLLLIMLRDAELCIDATGEHWLVQASKKYLSPYGQWPFNTTAKVHASIKYCRPVPQIFIWARAAILCCQTPSMEAWIEHRLIRRPELNYLQDCKDELDLNLMHYCAIAGQTRLLICLKVLWEGRALDRKNLDGISPRDIIKTCKQS